MYDLRAIRKTYVEAYNANGGDTVKAKLAALDEHKIPEQDRADVASKLSGSQDWDQISEIRTGTERSVCKKATRRPKRQTAPEFTLPHQDYISVLLADCATLAHEANEDVCPID